METTGKYMLKSESVINWHDAKDVPKREIRCHYIVALVSHDPKNPERVFWTSMDGIYDPETKEWVRYDIQNDKYLSFAGTVVGWAEYPVNFLDIAGKERAE